MCYSLVEIELVKSEILPEMIEFGPLCITDLFQNNSVAYSNQK